METMMIHKYQSEQRDRTIEEAEKLVIIDSDHAEETLLSRARPIHPILVNVFLFVFVAVSIFSLEQFRAPLCGLGFGPLFDQVSSINKSSFVPKLNSKLRDLFPSQTSSPSDYTFDREQHAPDCKGPFSSLRGPHITANFPDPAVIYHNGTTYAFGTNNRKPGVDLVHVQVATSHDNATWTVQPHLDALPHIAPWQVGNAVWAPDVKRLPDGRFLLYYTDGLLRNPSEHCIGAAISDVVTGPYIPTESPMICPHGGAIDPAGFLDRSTGKRYIVYKVDGNSLGHGGACNNDILPIMPTPIMLQEVDVTNGTTLVGLPTQILDRDVLDGPLIEAPAMYLSTEGIYFLFFSSNCFTTPLYNIDYATAKHITGPYKRASRPLLITGDGPGLGIVGPGGMDIIDYDYAMDDHEITDLKKKKKNKHKKNKHKHEREKEGHLVVFHGHMTVHNTPSDDNTQKPIQDLHRPFTRGMYSGIVHFRGRKITLREGGFEKADNGDEDGDES